MSVQATPFMQPPPFKARRDILVWSAAPLPLWHEVDGEGEDLVLPWTSMLFHEHESASPGEASVLVLHERRGAVALRRETILLRGEVDLSTGLPTWRGRSRSGRVRPGSRICTFAMCLLDRYEDHGQSGPVADRGDRLVWDAGSPPCCDVVGSQNGELTFPWAAMLFPDEVRPARAFVLVVEKRPGKTTLRREIILGDVASCRGRSLSGRVGPGSLVCTLDVRALPGAPAGTIGKQEHTTG